MKTILLDIETAPSLAYVWGFWNQNIGHTMVSDYAGYIMSCSIKTLGDPYVTYIENRTQNDKKIVQAIVDHLDEADFVIAHNGKKFDIPFIKARAVLNGIQPPSPFKVIDTLSIAKKEMKFQRNSLEFLADALDVDIKKSEHGNFPGFKLWEACIRGDTLAWEEMREYNIRDVEALEEVYLKLRPWASNHPNITTADEGEVYQCPKCGSDHVQRRGHYYTNKGKYQRYKCTECGGWSSSTYTENTSDKRKSLLASR